MNDRDTRAAILEAQTLALAETPATRGAIAQASALLRRAFAGQMEPDLISKELV